MPVIGRLDGQVDELIIKPISERRRGEEPPAPDDEDAPDKNAPEPLPPPETQTLTTQTPATNQSSAERNELPVWLL